MKGNFTSLTHTLEKEKENSLTAEVRKEPQCKDLNRQLQKESPDDQKLSKRCSSSWGILNIETKKLAYVRLANILKPKTANAGKAGKVVGQYFLRHC